MSHFASNLAALAPHFPTLAALLQQAPIPADFLPTPGTDGTPTFCRITTHDNKKRRDWLGATSMPAASAHPITASLDAAGPTGLGLSIATGFEWAAFIARLPRHNLLYIYEPDFALLRMALDICDLSPHLAARRLILLTGTPDGAAQSLATFLTTNPGFDPPTVLHPLPTLVGDKRNHLLTAGESIVRHAITTRQSLFTQLEQKITAALQSQIENPKSKIQNPHNLALLLTPRYPTERPIQNEATQRSAPIIILDHHSTTSPALRLQTLAHLLETGPVHILSDLFRHQLAPIPDAVSIETWIPPLIGPTFCDRLPQPGAFAPHDTITVHFGHHRQMLGDRGILQSQIQLRPLLPHLALAPTQNSALRTQHSPSRLALIADLPPSDAACLGIVLPTHQAVFAAARDLVADDYLAVHSASAPDLLRRALTRAGVDPKTTDPSLKEPVLRILRDVLIPALPVLILIANLARQGHPLTLIGDFPGLQTTLADIRTIPFAAYSSAAWNDVALCVHFSPQGTFSNHLWDAVYAGVPLIAPQHPADKFPKEALAGTLPQILKPNADFAHPAANNFLPSIKSLLHHPDQRRQLAANAIQHLTTLCASPGAPGR